MKRADHIRQLLACAGVAQALLIPAAAWGATCTVPGTHASIQGAVDDVSCSDIILGAGVFTGPVNIPRSLAITGTGSASTQLAGVLSIGQAGTLVAASGFSVVPGCEGSWLIASGGASFSGMDVQASWSAPGGGGCSTEDLIFADGFE